MKLRDARDDKSGSFSGCCSRSEMAGMCFDAAQVGSCRSKVKYRVFDDCSAGLPL